MAPELPQSATPQRIALAGVLGAAIAIATIHVSGLGSAWAAILLLSATAAPMWFLELQRYTNTSNRPLRIGVSAQRKTLRLRGVVFVLTLFATTIGIFRVTPAAPIVNVTLFPLIVFAGAWTLWILLRRPSDYGADSVEKVGIAALRTLRHLIRRKRARRRDHQLLLGWLIKAFYLPLMAGSSLLFLEYFREPFIDKEGFALFFAAAYQLFFAIDTAFATVGYLSTSSRIHAEIRSSESTLLGWSAALVCYPPFNLLVIHQWLSYKDGLDWDKWLAATPWISGLWGLAILLCVCIYVWATVSFGLRFSNLTNRGIITSGPYRYTKHPSYIFKNAAWWLISIPFVSMEGWTTAVGNTVALGAVGCIYWLRAWTEERHLMQDPAYCAYASWIAQHGALARLSAKLRS